MRRQYRHTLTAAALSAVLAAGGARAERFAGEFLSLPVGARAYAMGGAYGPLADDPGAVHWNPAGLARIAGPEIMMAHTELFGGLARHDAIALAWPMGRLALGAGWIRFGVDGIPRFSHTVGTPPQGTFGDNENAILLSAAATRPLELRGRRIELRGGGSAKAIYDRLDDRQATGIGLDLGLQAQAWPGELGGGGPGGRRWGALTLGLVISDLGGTAISWNTPREHQDVRPMGARFGAAYALAIPGLRTAALLCWETADDPLLRNRAGAELSYRGLAALRAGHDGQGATMGAGLSFWRLRLDYGFGRHDLGSTHRVSANFRI